MKDGNNTVIKVRVNKRIIDQFCLMFKEKARHFTTWFFEITQKRLFNFFDTTKALKSSKRAKKPREIENLLN